LRKGSVAIFDVFMAMKIQFMVFWVVMSIFSMKLEAERSSKLLVSYYITTLHNLEDHGLKGKGAFTLGNTPKIQGENATVL
jgi:hypothetical protein